MHPKHSYEALRPRDVMALLGAHNLSNNFEFGRLAAVVTSIDIHDDWNPHALSYDADIAMLTLEDPIHFTRYIKPICLWNSSNDYFYTTGNVAGWGKNEPEAANPAALPSLLKVQIHTNEDCFLSHKNLVDLSSKRTLCAGNGTGANVCHGDSGSGLYVENADRFYLQAIVSSSLTTEYGKCDVSKFSIYTKAAIFADWILNKITTVRPGKRFL